MAIVRISTDLPLSAAAAFALAQKPALFQFVVRPVLRVSGLPRERFAAAVPGDELNVRMWWFGVLPGWRHRLRIVSAEPYELYTNERGGLLRSWNHRLTFAPRGDDGCRYTDEVTLDAGPATPLVWVFAQLLFRWRQARWRALARVLA